MRIKDSELIINQDGSVFHLHLKPEDLAEKIAKTVVRTRKQIL